MIKVVDFGSQLTQNIARRIREFGVYTEIVPFHTSADKVLEDDLEGIILSGGQFSVYDSEAPKCSKEIFELGVPVLGICYGLQLLTEIFGGKISSAENREYGEARIDVLKDNRLLIPGINETNLKVWMSHGDIVNEPPPDYEVIARSDKGHIAGLRNGDIYAVQFHPEVDHTDHGRQILNNFIEICGADKTWDPSQDYDRIVRDVSERLRGRVGVGGISGGVDSSSVSVLVNKIVGQDYHPIFVDNGLLRLDEAAEVMRSLESYGLGINLVDAGERFLLKLEGVSDPDEKRRIIGHEFIDVFQEQARKIEGASYLVQGTLYPDVIESVPLYEKSSVIKRHHNVGGLPDRMELEVVEPFRHLFKDEVRKMAREKLGMGDELVYRHPSPGPGLAIRIMGDVTSEKLDILRRADFILNDEIRERGLYREIDQAFAGLSSNKTTGVMGDEGTYEGEIRIRTICSNDFMTADVFRYEWDDLQAISNRIVSEIKGVNRVSYDISQKPPATIEWE